MVKYVLTIRGTVVKAADKPYKLVVQAVDVGFHNGTLALLLNFKLDLTSCLFYCFFNSRGMDTSVLNELFKRYSCYLTSYMVMAGKRYSLGGIVNDKVNTCELFKRTDVSALTADYSALHFVIGQGHYGYCHLRYGIGGKS